ncbi:MAG: SMI1/KNR4 family protein [Roseivirga sp.]|nr:SMI1/KNR4 family protein [Roseivirga sp.]
MNQFIRVKNKLKRLKRADKTYSVFGAEKHKYKLNAPLKEKAIDRFEKEFNIRLPEDYRLFLKELGNGGAGPYYGLEPLENGRYADLHYKDADDLINPGLSFPHTDHWNFQEAEFIPENEEKYFDNKWANGLLRIADYGCGMSLNLVVNGLAYGNIWVDSRVNDAGIFPDPFFKPNGRLSFLEWYEAWLDQSMDEASNQY